MRIPHFLLLLFFVVLSANWALAEDSTLIAGLASSDSNEKIAALDQLANESPEKALSVLQALANNTLYLADGRLIIEEKNSYQDALSGEQLAQTPENLDGIVVNNRVRKHVASALAALNLLSSDNNVRLHAAENLAKAADAHNLPLILTALQKEQNKDIFTLLQVAKDKASLQSPDAPVRKQAVLELAKNPTPSTRQLLMGLLEKRGEAWVEPDSEVRSAAEYSLHIIEGKLRIGENLNRIFTGISLGSILLLAAMGLAVTYGVMGVINMAHGELLMIGAYATYTVQVLFNTYLPQWSNWYLLAALPCGFLASAITGMVLERLVIRHLYGRPLETLLATWGLSLILIQAVRTLFGAQNVAVANPLWMAGSVTLMPNLILPWNRIIIIGFSMAVLAGMWAILNLTRLGLFVRAVTQNRSMSSCVGVATGKIDTLAFGLGAGIAGLGGVALSQVSNVGPDMGQGYIVDSFMVVVLGGVGQLAGTVWAALGLGITSKFFEVWSGAVIAKIAVLVIVIVVIQKRPQGLFALKGRTVES